MKKDFPTEYQSFIHKSRYARWLEEEGRRETWDETVNRYIDFMTKQGNLKGKDLAEAAVIRNAIVDLEVMPSMRCLMTAGEALERDNVAGYNCSYVAVDSPRVFDETMYVLMCGTGVGFSVERQYVQKLPEIAEEFHNTDTCITVADSKIGWAKAYREFVQLLYAGQVPKWDVSRVRPAGSKLKTMGGRASGPEPLIELFKFTIEVFKNARGRKLTSLECHDIMCKVADIVVVGGVRRSALISLSNLTDERMRTAKSGDFGTYNPQRYLANNSVAYTEKPDMGIFMKEWLSLYESKSGERGIFSRVASDKVVARNGRRDTGYEWGTNPCSEIILRSKQFCNLSEVVVRKDDTFDDLKRKVRLATILGTLQSTLTNFRYLSKAWSNNTEEERLLGVSLTGIMDHPVLCGAPYHNADGSWPAFLGTALKDLKEVAIETNKEWAKKLGIPESTAITCVKPSGTVSQLVDASSGIHTRHSPFYIRTVRADKKDPLAQFMAAEGFPCEDDVTKPEHNLVFSFPIKAPEDSVTDLTALQQLELWKVYAEHWCEHKPSITVTVKENEWMEVGAWVYHNFDIISGISFLPYSEHIYEQAPYQEIDEEEYKVKATDMPQLVDWVDGLRTFEKEDTTVGSKTYACSADSCEVVDLTKE